MFLCNRAPLQWIQKNIDRSFNLIQRFRSTYDKLKILSIIIYHFDLLLSIIDNMEKKLYTILYAVIFHTQVKSRSHIS
jgi:hypothetical protein